MPASPASDGTPTLDTCAITIALSRHADKTCSQTFGGGVHDRGLRASSFGHGQPRPPSGAGPAIESPARFCPLCSCDRVGVRIVRMDGCDCTAKGWCV